MAIEIERKYLIEKTGWKSLITKSDPIIQGYIQHSANITVRIRVSGQHGFITVKGPRVGISRTEYEYEIPVNDAKSILLESDAITVRKVRHTVIHDGDEWVIDVFKNKNKGLIMAEIELKSEDQKYSIPDWVLKDISLDQRYRNSKLALNPYTLWEKDEK